MLTEKGIRMKTLRFVVLMAFLVSLFAVSSAQADDQLATTFTFDVHQFYHSPTQQVSISYCRQSATGDAAQATITIPSGIVLPGTCGGASDCTYNGGFGQNPPGLECYYLYGYPMREGYFTFRADFYEPSTEFTQTITRVVYLKPVGNPRIMSITPQCALPGQEITINGIDLMQLGYREPVSSLQVWFTDPVSRGVYWFNYFQVNEWSETAIRLNLPASLQSGKTYEVLVVRGSINSAPPYHYTVGSSRTRYFFPLVLR